MIRKICASLVILLCLLGTECSSPTIRIAQGTLRGSTRVNKDGDTYYSFQNIPYAKPPIGDLRFKAPEPADGWDGIRDASVDLPLCIQRSFASTAMAGQEDCLYLNVYTPELPSNKVTKKPVMVFIHGGAFTSGSAVESNYGGDFLLTKDIVLVVINYRVGLFGFMNLDDPNLPVPGNAGLKDQVMALKWVNKNIKRFGGDPANILIFGQSAGSISVHLHVLSPMSKGLFKKAITQSGAALATVSGTRNNSVLLAEMLHIQTSNWDEMLISLQGVSAESIFAAEQILTVSYPYISTPIVEIPSIVPSFIQENPLDIIRSGNYSQVPLITGFNNEEGLLLQLTSRLTTGQSILITDFTAFIPEDLLIEPGSEDEQVLSEKIKYFYYGDTEPSRDNITGAVNLYRDFAFAFPTYRSTLEYLNTAVNPIYFYYFSADTGLNFAKMLDITTATYPGAAHSDELGYLLNNFLTPSVIEDDSTEGVAWRNMVDLWTNFAIYDNPTPDNFEKYKWEPVLSSQFKYLHIATAETFMDVDPIPKNMQFWADIYDTYFEQNN